MATDIVMPRLSDSMEEGTILQWLKSQGDEVDVGDELVEIETDKANMVYEADASGTLIEITAEEGATLAIGEVIARVGEAGEKPAGGDGAAEKAKPEEDEEEAEPEAGEEPEAEAEEGEPEEAEEETEAEEGEAGDEPEAEPEAEEEPEAEGARAREEAEAEPAPAGQAPAATAERPPEPAAPAVAGDGRAKASPLARRIARERGLDLSQLQGSGPGGRIVKADVERAEAAGAAAAEAGEAAAPAAPEAPAAPAPAAPTAGARERPETARGETETVELSKLQQTVARRMAESKATAPHFYLSAEVEMTAAVEARARIKAAAGEGDVVPSLNDLVVKACAIALREHPRANGAYRDGKLELYSRVNVGVAVAARDALVVPTIFDADRKGLREIATEARALAQRVREGTVTPPELSGGTFTVSNLGMYGISNFSAVINPPQAAILAVGEVAEKPVARDGELEIARLMGVTLACDHRILYGADGALFLGRVRQLLEEPLALAL
jgi:pyruvate dehydrogenase E2 component (dihydrolipoamide acetyltransferase)